MNDIPQFLFLILWVAMVVFAFSIMAQGWMISSGRNGYSKRPTIKHPEMNEVTSGEPLLVVNFDKMPDDEYNELNQRIQKLKLDELVDDDDDDDDEDDGQFIGAGI